MKTTDLIPLILYQLVNGDKYGYEIVKQIEDTSNGSIVIKQPTLYSVLKKLEQGKFISSYWQDSEIGGKRHYYQLTDNGKAQLDTYPSFEQLIKDCVDEEMAFPTSSSPAIDLIHNATDNVIEQPLVDNNTDNITVYPTINEVKQDELNTDYSEMSVEADEQQEVDNNIEDKNVEPIELSTPADYEEIKIEPIKIDLTSPTNATFNDTDFDFNHNNINTSSTNPINIFDAIEPAYDEYSTPSNSVNAIDNNVEAKDENLINPISIETTTRFHDIEPENIDVQQDNEDTATSSKFTEKIESIQEPIITNKLYNKLTPNEELASQVENTEEEEYSPTDNLEQVKYLNYIDFSTDKSTIKRRKTINKHINKMTLTCLTLIIMLVGSIVLANKYSFSKLYYISAIIVCLVIVLYPIMLLRNISKLKLKYCSKPFKYSISRDFFIKLSMFLTITIVVVAYNLSLITSVSDMFKLTNFANLIAPIVFASAFIFDFVYSVLCYRKYKK